MVEIPCASLLLNTKFIPEPSDKFKSHGVDTPYKKWNLETDKYTNIDLNHLIIELIF